MGAISLPVLAALVDKSLVRPTADYYYDMHELLRHYVLEKFEANAAAHTAARDRHAAYYAYLLEQRESLLTAGER